MWLNQGMQVIGIAGGSGTGKSTVCYELVDSDPERYEVLNFDDYQRVGDESDDLPMLHGFVNWDHPDIIRWDRLIKDIKKLKANEPVTLNVWAHRSNSDYAEHRQLKTRTIYPRPVLLVEGYMTLQNAELNDLYDMSFYFDLDEATRNTRRDKAVFTGKDAYEEKVLKPMFKKYVEPTKENADFVLDVSQLSVQAVVNFVESKLSG
jgi:uridine kinase